MNSKSGRLVVLLLLAVAVVTASSLEAGTLFAVQESGDNLVTIDTLTLAVTPVGPLGVPFEFGGLAWDPNTQTLYMIGGRGNPNLYTVDPSTGTATLIGLYGVADLFGLAFDSRNNTLYGTQFSGGSGLYELNTSTGAATLIGTLTNQIGGLAYNPFTDALVGMEDGAGDLYEINRSDASQTLLFDGPFVNDSGLAFDPDLNLYWDIDWDGNLFSYDPTSGYSRTTQLSGLGSHDGLAYQSAPLVLADIPTLSSVGLFVLIALIAGIGVVCVRRIV